MSCAAVTPPGRQSALCYNGMISPDGVSVPTTRTPDGVALLRAWEARDCERVLGGRMSRAFRFRGLTLAAALTLPPA